MFILRKVRSDSFLLGMEDKESPRLVLQSIPHNMCQCRRFVVRMILALSLLLILAVYFLILPYTLAFSGFIHIDHNANMQETSNKLKIYRDKVDFIINGIMDSYPEDKKLNNSTNSTTVTEEYHGNEQNNELTATTANISREEFVSEKLRILHQAVENLRIILTLTPPAQVYRVNHTTASEYEICDEYTREPTYDRPRVQQVWRPINSYHSDDVTLVTQMSADRLHLLAKTLEHWTGPVSAAIYINESGLGNLTAMVQQYPLLLERNNVEFQLMYKVGVYWPVNILRNLALDNAPTDLVFLTDADFVPSYGLHEKLKNYSRSMDSRNRVYVVPAFEFLEDPGSFYPRNKTELIQHWKKQVTPFYKIQPFDWYFYRYSHGPTQFDIWENTKSIYKVHYKVHFEPYVLANRTNIPRYNDQFVGRIQDKISHLYEVHVAGFEFHVLPDVFIIHYAHPNQRYVDYNNCGLNLWKRHQKMVLYKYTGKISFF